MTDATLYAQILKMDEQPDGSLMVHGIATDDSIDSDDQICDPEWLKRAMPQWFKYGNIREQHSNIAAGVATEYRVDGSQHVITAHVVDKGSVAKLRAKVLKGFSVGIRNVRVVADKAAAGGRIIDGDIVEVSIVDRPANPSCVLELAKATGGIVLQVENLIEKDGSMDECAKCGKSAELDDENLCATCAGEKADTADDKTTPPTDGDDPVDDSQPAGGEDAADEKADEDTTDAPDDEKGEGDPDDPDADDEEAEEDILTATLSRIESKLDDLLSAGKATSTDTTKSIKALEERVVKVEKSAKPGVSRTSTKAAQADTDDSASKVAEYEAKAAHTDDPLLRQGFLDLAHELKTKAATA